MLTHYVRIAGKQTRAPRGSQHITPLDRTFKLMILRDQQLLIVSSHLLSQYKQPTSLFATDHGHILSSIQGFIKRLTL
jgi:hypothetical protein